MADISTNASKILVIVGAFVGFAVLVVFLRVFVRSMMLKIFGPNDYVMVTAALCAIATWPDSLQWVFWHNISVTLGISFVKISVALFLLRIVIQKAYKIFLCCMIVFLIVFTLTCFGTLVFSCLPVRASWDYVPGPKCFTAKEYTNIGLFNSCINITTDILFASLPIAIAWKLNANFRTRITLIGVLSLGFVACAAAIAKADLQSHVMENHDSYRHDAYSIWNIVELCVGILAASLPALRPLFRSLLETTNKLGSQGKTTGTTESGGLSNTSARNNYYIQGQGIGLDNFPLSGTESKPTMLGPCLGL